jgi:hypothetical protein
VANSAVIALQDRHSVQTSTADAQRILTDIVRTVADLPRSASPMVVWSLPPDELTVDISTTTIECGPGLIKISIEVSCVELTQENSARIRISVPFGVGRLEKPRGLLMATMSQVVAPLMIAERWSDAITAFCWEALLELASRVAAEAGVDQKKRPLIPGNIAAEKGMLIIQPMARHDLRALGRDEELLHGEIVGPR